MTYSILLFDADGTILDFKESERIGLENVFKEKQLPFSEEMRNHYLNMNDQLWRGFEEGKYPKQHIFDVRFQRLLDAFHIEGDGREWEKAYREQLNQGCHVIAQAKEVLSALAKQYRLYIITNGVSHTQYQRIKGAGLEDLFAGIFVSEDIGYQKPQIEYFDYVLEHIDGDKKEMLVIGDSLHSDILGANKVGIDSCWYNPENLINDSAANPTYEIACLEDLWNLL